MASELKVGPAPLITTSNGEAYHTSSKFLLNGAILLVVSAAACGIYLLNSARSGGLGFPLDDAWIHQTYARNLGLHGEFAFIPGQPSAGSTAPLWSAMLAVGHRLGLAPYAWTYLLGWLSLWSLSLLGMWVFTRLCPQCRKWGLVAGIFLALEWHLVWAAVSGMETLLSAVLALLVCGLILLEAPPWFWLGALTGLSAWVRPDGITLLGPAVLAAVLIQSGWSRRVASLARLGFGFVLLFLPYLFFNYSLSGSLWPNTFFAKQAEYASELQASLVSRLGEQYVLPLVGAGILLLPGFLYIMWRAFRRREWGAFLGGIWVISFLSLYAMRLPVSYQHGRYVMPVMPVYLIWGLAGLVELVAGHQIKAAWRVLGRAWAISTVLVLLVFFFVGAGAYQRDVALIESEMVETAQWIAGNTAPGALVAAHDIGALGYFGQRPLVDLAGLVSPEVIPFIRDEQALAEYLDHKNADYLVAFPGWYPYLVSRATPIWTSRGTVSTQLGGENLAVYQWDTLP